MCIGILGDCATVLRLVLRGVGMVSIPLEAGSLMLLRIESKECALLRPSAFQAWIACMRDFVMRKKVNRG